MSEKMMRLSAALYRVLLYLYPAAHRRAYGRAMLQTFRDLSRDAYANGGSFGLVRLWGETLVDTLFNAILEHSERGMMSRKTLFVLGLTLVFSVFTGYVNITATEVQSPMFCILLFSFIAGLLQPKAAWRWALLIGLSIPLSTFAGLAINFAFPDAPPRFPITLVVLVIPALLAAYMGVFLRRITPPAGHIS